MNKQSNFDLENFSGFQIVNKFTLPELIFKVEYKNKYNLDKLLVGDCVFADKKTFNLVKASAAHFKKNNIRFNYTSVRLTRKVYALSRIPVEREIASKIRNDINVFALKEDFYLLDKNKHTLALYYGVSDRTIRRMLDENNIS